MSQFRQNPLTGQWVSIAPQRARRPLDYEPNQETSQRTCPFCQGQEESTPEESLAIRSADSRANGPGWKVRVVANRYPFVTPELDNEDESAASALFPIRPGEGLQEVIIESPRHVSDVTQLSVSEWSDVLLVYRTRLRQLRDDGRWKYVLIFKNSGEAAGASLSHIHSQLIALPSTPADVEAMNDRLRLHFDQHGRSLLADVVEQEIAAGQRVIHESEHFVALCPFASRQPYEMQVIPKRHSANFDEIADAALSELAALLRDLIARLEKLFQPLAFNWLIRTCPFDTISKEHYHWHVEIVPRVTKTAGYEWATGYAVNIVSPETAAQQLQGLGTAVLGSRSEKR